MVKFLSYFFSISSYILRNIIFSGSDSVKLSMLFLKYNVSD